MLIPDPMSGIVLKKGIGPHRLSKAGFPVNRSTASRFGKLDAIIIMAVIIGLLGIAGFLHYVLTS